MWELDFINGGYFAFIFLCCICCLYLIVSVALYVLIVNDAKKSNVENPQLWGVLTLIFGFPILIVYYLAIKPAAQKVTTV
jgi:hypothetical protein